MHVHSVYFWLDDIGEEERSRFKEGLKALTGIDLVKKGFVGVPAEKDRAIVDNSYDFSLVLFFEHHEDEKAYQDHPIHQEFLNDCESFWDDIVVYDSVDAY